MKNHPDVKLRALEPDDVDIIYNLENTADGWRYGYAPAPLSRFQIWQYIKTYDADPMSAGQLRLMIDDEAGATIGIIDLYDIDQANRRAKVGIIIVDGCRRRGYASAAIGRLAAYCRNNLGLHQLCAEVAADNHISMALFAKAGFTTVARLPQWFRHADRFTDCVVMTLPMATATDSAAPIRYIAD